MYDELVKALRGCVLSKPCDDCPYYDPNGPTEKCATMNIAAADAIEELTRENKELSFRAAQLEAMNDALIGETGATDALIVSSKPRWIPVAERLPKTDDLVIVAIHDDSGDTPYDVTNVGFYLDVFPLGIWIVENERCNYVTHWMPLPEPPEEET